MHTHTCLQTSKKTFGVVFLHTSAVAMVTQHYEPVKVPDWLKSWRAGDEKMHGERGYCIGCIKNGTDVMIMTALCALINYMVLIHQ